MDPSYQELMALFDAAADLPADEQAMFLAKVERHQAALAQPLVELLAADSAETNDRLLAGLDVLQQGIERIISVTSSMPLRGDEPDEAPFSKGTVIGQYELIRPLARGGAGDVYLARDVRLGRRVAIKLLRHDLDAAAAADRFLAEARITALCRHENIVVIHDVGSLPGYSYMVLEYVEGTTLRDWIDHHWRSGGPSVGVSTGAYTKGGARSRPHSFRVSVRQALSLIVPVVRALVHAHSLGMVHRDLKPENIMIAEDGPLKVLDFGIAKLLDDGLRLEAQILNIQWLDEARNFYTRTGFLTGTLPYMSPEQWRAEDVDERSDLWAIGVILSEILTGQHPMAPLSLGRLATVRDRDIAMPSISEAYPQLGAVGAIIDRCLVKDRSKRMATAVELLHALDTASRDARALPADVGTRARPTVHPFVGLSSYEEGDAQLFFGRDQEVELILQKLRHHSLVTVIGPSGSGKSSFIRAGVLPALKRGDPQTETHIVRPGQRAMDGLAELLVGVAQDPDSMSLAARIDLLRRQPGALGAAIRDHIRATARTFVLFIDQFEELYTLEADLEVRRLFVGCIGSLIDDVSLPIRVVVALRSDFLDRVAEDRGFSREVLRGLMLLSPMDGEGLRQALTCPLEAVGYTFETDTMVDTMLDALRTTKSPLPLLQFTAAKLWELRDARRRRLTMNSYREMGGVAGALAFHADGVLANLSSSERKAARFVLTRLVTLERSRTPSSLAALRAQAPIAVHKTIDIVVERLIDARLIRIERGSTQGPVVELSHESLIDRWPLLVEWLSEDQDEARFKARLQNAASAWIEHGRSVDLLWRGAVARDARRWMAQWRSEGKAQLERLNEHDRAFLQNVVEAETAAQRRMQYIFAAVIGALCLVIAVVFTLAVQARRSADQAAAHAALADKEARRARAESIVAHNVNRMSVAREHFADPTLVLALVREVDPRFLPTRWAALARRALQRGPATRVYDYPDPVLSASFGPKGRTVVVTTANGDVVAHTVRAQDPIATYRGHTDDVYAAAVSPDGRRLITACWDGSARIYDFAAGGDPLVRLPHADAVLSVSYSPDGRWAATSSKNGAVRVFRANGQGEPVVFRDHESAVWSVAFSADSARIVSASADGTARIRYIDGRSRSVVLRGHSEDVVSASFSPDGRYVVTASWDKTVRLFETRRPFRSRALLGHRGLATSAAFSPDGRLVATASADKMVRIYTVDGGYLHTILQGPRRQINSVSFSPDGQQIVVSSSDGSVRLYPVYASTRLQVLRGHRDTVYSVALSVDGRRVATASADGTTRIYSTVGYAPPIVLPGHSGAVWSAVFDPSGQRVVTAANDGTVWIRTVDGTRKPVALRGHTGMVYSAVFSPDGRAVVTASGDMTARLYSADGAAGPTLTGHTDAVYSAVFSPDAQHILTASRDGTARLYRVDRPKFARVFPGNGQGLTSAAFSPDGRLAVTASLDKKVRVYRLDAPETPLYTFQHDGVASVGRPGAYTFDPEGQRVLSFSEDRSIRLWSLLATQPVPVGFQPLRFDPWAVSLSADGARMVSASHPELNDPHLNREAGFTAWVWNDIEPLVTPYDERLWSATTYCPSVSRRMALLGVSKARARAGYAFCQQRVAEVNDD